MTAMNRAGIFALLIVAASCSDPPPDDDDTNVATGGSTANGGAGVGGSAAGGAAVGGMATFPALFTVVGRVVDQNGDPLAGATVLQGGKSDQPTLTTDVSGSFSLQLSYPGYGRPGVVAGREGYRMGGLDFNQVPEAPIELVLDAISTPDNPSYEYRDPGMGNGDISTNFCGHCHEQFARDFQLSAHRGATSNNHLQDLYAGVAAAFATPSACANAGGEWKAGLTPGSPGVAQDRCYVGSGVLDDLNPTCGGSGQQACDDPAAGDDPTAFGACADCHAPGINGPAGGRNLHDATEIAYDYGVSCDVCHKVRDIDLTKAPGVAGRLVLQRPNELNENFPGYKPVFYGPLLDVPNAFMGAVYQPKFNQAEFCAGCHQQLQPALLPGDALAPGRWPNGLPVHTTFQEWQDGPYAPAGVPCQSCHMPPHFDQVSSIGTATIENQSITFGYPRPPEDNREHVFRGPLYDDGTEPRLIDTALFASVNLSLNGAALDASVSVSNVGCGHAVPTGEPMRALVMIVTASGTGCGDVPATGGMTINDVGGVHAQGVVGADVTANGAVLDWPVGAATAQPTMVARVVRPTGAFDDYRGIGFFANAALTPAEKGLPVYSPVGEANVLAVGAGQITLDASLVVQAGDVVFLGDTIGGLTDGGASTAMAGASGYTFAKVLLDAGSQRHVPHYRAVDVVSDNRIAPGGNQITSHAFDVSGCTDVTVRATILYRPRPLSQAKLRGWNARDYVIATAEQSVTVP